MKTVVLATDFSAASANALEHAALLAQRYGATLHALHVAVKAPADDPALQAAFPDREKYQQALAKIADENLAGVATSFEVPIIKKVVSGVAAPPVIVDYARNHRADVVVLGSHGRQGLSHVLLGSVAQRVVRMANVPVLVVGQGERHQLSKGAYGRVLLPVDLSAASGRARQIAGDICRSHGADLIAVHVIEPALDPLYSAAPFDTDITTRAEMTVRRYLDEVGDLQPTLWMAKGRVHEEITRIAREQKVDLIVIGTAGSGGGLGRLMVGSVTGRVLRSAPCPVLAVTPPHAR